VRRATLFLSRAGFGLLATLVGCSGTAVTDGSASSVGGSGDAGSSSTAGKPGTGGSGIGGSGVGGSGVGGSGVGGSGVGGSGVGGSGVGGSGVGGNAGSLTAGSTGTGASAGAASECTEGETMAAGCNGCKCFNGHWACTTIACPSVTCGGFAGDTCKATEYCAYTAGQLCGQADASATCQLRPDGCVDLYMPVCGCDHVTYASSCDAAMHGQGVYTEGVCDQGPVG
jgi:Pacifastin inhibitor (LCMII)/Kazal-type serine protease inhibitor domain